jgi:hypothetical protein
MAQITYDDKSNSLPTSNPRRLFRAIDANEVKNVVNTNDTDTSAALALRELLANKAVDFSILNNTLYPTIQAVENRILAAIVGMSWKTPVAVATTGNITLSGEQTIDGVLTSASRVLVKDQSTASQNGIYVTGAGAWARATDMDVSAEFNGAAVTVLSGTSNANTTWIQTADNVTVGSTSIVWAQLGTSVPDASENGKGIIEIADQAETNTGTDDVRAVTPLKLNTKLRATRTVTGTNASVQTDDNSLIIFNSATPFNFTLDQLTASSKISFVNIGAGDVTFVNGAGVTTSGDVILPGAVGTVYPTALVFYHTATTPRVINSTIEPDIIVVDTSGATITLDFAFKAQRVFVGNAAFATPKTIALANADNAVSFQFIPNISNVAAVLTFPTEFTMQNSDDRWVDASHQFTAEVTGKHKFVSTYDGTDYTTEASNPYS